LLKFTTFVALLVALAVLPARPASSGSLCGTILDAQTNAPIAHAGVFVRTTAGYYTGFYAATDITGAFCINNVPPGTYGIEVRVDDFQVAYRRGLVVGITTDVEIAAGRPLELATPAPNPASTTSRLTWSQPRASRVRLAIYDLRGRIVRGWSAASLPAGTHGLTWDLRDASYRTLTPGTYFIDLEADGAHRVRSITLIR